MQYWFYNIGPRSQYFKTFNLNNLPPLDGISVILCYKIILQLELPEDCSKWPWKKALEHWSMVANLNFLGAAVIYCHILTLENVGNAVNYHGILEHWHQKIPNLTNG